MKRKSIVGLIAIVAIIVAVMLAGCVEEQSQTIEIKVIYCDWSDEPLGEWSGSYGDIDSTKSVDGIGVETLLLPNAKSIVSGSFQKGDSTNEPLTVQILKNGEVVQSESTTAAYGVVSVSYTL